MYSRHPPTDQETFCDSADGGSDIMTAAWASLADSISSSDPVEASLFELMHSAVQGSRAAGSLKSYKSPWGRFSTWCVARSPPRCPLPALHVTVALFLCAVAATSNTYAPVKSASAAIFTAHDMGLAGAPTKHPLCKLVRQGLKRKFGLRLVNRKEPLAPELVVAFAECFASPSSPLVHLMLATFVSLCFAGFLRYSDAIIVFADEVKFYATHIEIFLETRKNDQYRFGNVIVIARGSTPACPSNLVARLISAAGLRGRHVPLFQKFDGNSKNKRSLHELAGTAISYGQARYHVLRCLAKVAGISLEESTALYGLQSMRSGGATAAAAADVSDRLFQQHGCWRSEKVKDGYVADSLAARLSVTQALGY
jgi:hypothetical protein